MRHEEGQVYLDLIGLICNIKTNLGKYKHRFWFFGEKIFCGKTRLKHVCIFVLKHGRVSVISHDPNVFEFYISNSQSYSQQKTFRPKSKCGLNEILVVPSFGSSLGVCKKEKTENGILRVSTSCTITNECLV